MATLKCKFKKDDHPFTDCSELGHDGDTNLSVDEQRAGMEFVLTSLNRMCDKFRELGYDPQTIRFSIKTKK